MQEYPSAGAGLITDSHRSGRSSSSEGGLAQGARPLPLSLSLAPSSDVPLRMKNRKKGSEMGWIQADFRGENARMVVAASGIAQCGSHTTLLTSSP